MKNQYYLTFWGCVICNTALLFALTAQPLRGQESPTLPLPSQTLTSEQLGDMVAPIALYPDVLLGQILVASTYPLEMVQLSQWLARNQDLSGAALTQAAEQQTWDPSVQALVVFPELVKRLIQDISWTTNLGNAFLHQQADVMDAVQRMRLSAQQAGKLSSTTQQNVNMSNESGQTSIEIEPADPQVIYLPYYNPMSIWGPFQYYPYASWYYPPFIGGSFFGFGTGIRIGVYFGSGWGGWGGWGWRPGWGNRTIIVNNNFIHRYNFNAGRGARLDGRTSWSHDPVHRQAVPYATPELSSRYGGAARQNPEIRQPAAGRTAPGGGARQQPGSERMGNRQIAPSEPRGNPSVFGGIREGGSSRVQSDRGHSSLGPARGSAGDVGGATRPGTNSAPRQGSGSPGQGGLQRQGGTPRQGGGSGNRGGSGRR